MAHADNEEKLTLATRHDVEICLALALTSGRALARSQAAETMSKIVGERFVASRRLVSMSRL
jgi:hypothetical protein